MSSGVTCLDRPVPTVFSSPSGEGLSMMSSYETTISSWKGQDSMAITIGQSRVDTLLNLWETYIECSSPNWDGYGADPVTRDTFQIAESVLHSLPTSIPMPDIAPEPGGEIGFEWRKDKKNVIVVTVNDKSRLNFAAIYGRDTMRGSTDFEEILPMQIIKLIARIAP